MFVKNVGSIGIIWNLWKFDDLLRRRKETGENTWKTNTHDVINCKD